MSTLLSIDIGSSKMKFVLGKVSKKSIEIKKMFYAQTPAGSVNNGEVLDIKRLREALLVEVQNQKISGLKTVVTIQSGDYISQEYIIPKIKEKDVESALRYEVEQHMSITLDDYILSYREIESIPDPDGPGNVKYLVGLMPQRIVSSYYQLIRSVRLKPAAMDVNSNAIEKLLNFAGQSLQEGILLLVDIGNDAMDLTVFDNGVPKLNRASSAGGAEITRNLIRTFGIDYDEAEVKKLQSSALIEDEAGAEPELTIVTKKVIDGWIEQIKKTADIYKTGNQGKDIELVYIYGGSSAIKRLEDYLSESLGIKCCIMALPDNITLKQSSPAPVYTYFNAIGAIIRR